MYAYAAAGLSGHSLYAGAIPLSAYAALTKLAMSPKGHPRIVRPGRFQSGPDDLANFDTCRK
jgi:hypothetical protein